MFDAFLCFPRTGARLLVEPTRELFFERAMATILTAGALTFKRVGCVLSAHVLIGRSSFGSTRQFCNSNSM